MSGAAFLILALALGTPSAEDEQLLAQAQAAFTQGVALRQRPEEARAQFHRAAELYHQLHDRGYASAELLSNEGNAWFLADDLPRAILAYRRGFLLDPTHPDLRANLAAAREKVLQNSPTGFGSPPVDQRPPWLPRLRLAGMLFTTFAILYSLSWLALTRWWMVRRPGWLALGLLGMSLVTLALWMFWREGRDVYEAKVHPLVVIAEDGVVLRKGNGLAYPARSETPLPRGAEARLLYRRGDWLQLELSGGEIGWVPAAYALIDLPPSDRD